MKFLHINPTQQIHLEGHSKIIPREALGEIIEASALVEKVKKEREHAKTECKELRAKAKKEGYAEGEKRGYTEFYEKVIHFDERVEQIHRHMQSRVIDLAMMAAEKIVRQELATDKSVHLNIIMDTLKPLIEDREFIIFVAREDYQNVMEAKSEFGQLLEPFDSIEVRMAEDVEPGDIKIQTERGIIASTLADQSAALKAALERYYKGGA